MSTRAYKLIEIKTEDSPTFNLWHDDFITENLLYSDEESIISVDRVNIEDMLKNFETYWKEYKGEDKTAENKIYYKETLEQMLKECEDNDYVEYYCF